MDKYCMCENIGAVARDGKSTCVRCGGRDAYGAATRIKHERKKNANPLREKLADLEHQQWAHWTDYMLDNLTEENIKRWREQCRTQYEDLTEKEKDSDRVWADKVFKTITLHNYKQAFGSQNHNNLKEKQ